MPEPSHRPPADRAQGRKRNGAARVVYMAIGGVSLVMGVIGIVLPIWPTAIFVIIAAWAFARSSPRLEAWLENHRHLGPPLVAWRRHGVIRRRAKIFAVAAMATSIIMVAITTKDVIVTATVAAILCAVAVFVVSRPEAPAAACDRENDRPAA